MKITKSTFVTSVAKANNIIVDSMPQIAFVGRSNVGKSSLINMLTGNGKLAKTSSTPGRTRLINYFLVNDKFYFVDLPGYGFAKASKTEVVGWQSLIEPYISDNTALKLVCVLVDSRHEPTDMDRQMVEYLSYWRVPFVVIATKCDKFGKSQIKPALAKVASALKLGTANVLGVSTITKYGKEAILDKFDQFV